MPAAAAAAFVVVFESTVHLPLSFLVSRSLHFARYGRSLLVPLPRLSLPLSLPVSRLVLLRVSRVGRRAREQTTFAFSLPSSLSLCLVLHPSHFSPASSASFIFSLFSLLSLPSAVARKQGKDVSFPHTLSLMHHHHRTCITVHPRPVCAFLPVSLSSHSPGASVPRSSIRVPAYVMRGTIMCSS